MKFIDCVKIFIICSFLVGFGCGSGGGGGSVPAQHAVLKLSTNPFAPYTTLGGVRVRISLPVGSTVATDGTGAVQNGVITPIGVLAASGQVGFVSYSAPTVNLPGAIKFFMVTPIGDMSFKDGEFAQVLCNFSGTAPVKSSFLLTLAATSADGHSAVANETFTLSIQ